MFLDSTIILYLLSFLLLWQFVGYPLLMALTSLITKQNKKDYSYQPSVSIIVPAYNEEKVIEERINNLLDLDYPAAKYEIIIVESGSSDRTFENVKKITDVHNGVPSIKLIKEKGRKGKASAINIGREHAKGEIILVTDANSTFDNNVLKEMMPHFQDSKVGGVGGRYVVSNPEYILAASESFYWDLEYLQRKGESIIDSACLFHGEIYAWRKELVKADTEIISDDLDIAVQIRKKGFRIEYEPEAIVYEPSTITAKEQIIQRKKTTIGTMQVLMKHWRYFFIPRDVYSLFIFPSHKTLAMISPFLMSGILVLYVIIRDITIIKTHFVITMALFTGSLTMLVLLRSKLVKKKVARNVFSISGTLNMIYYVLLNEYLILLAWKDFLSGRYSVLWEKVDSLREG